ncbi:TOBE domain-containing protein [Nocardia alni]|uniref:TOBE domain-containing protein n=1 Tax=Nocardia alni TaxID=2815723 RepID=UPI001C223DAC|nr:TOBE domain-containing protein [Nocardia alni]
MPEFRLSEVARLLGVSDDTVRRWTKQGQLAAVTDSSGRQAVDGVELARFAVELADRDRVGERSGTQSARNQFPGIVTNVTRDTVMAQVEIQSGPHRVVSLISRESCDELGLEIGVPVVAAVKSTNVVLHLD